MIKSRSLAQKLIKSGGVRIDGDRATKTSATIQIGAILTIAYANRIIILKVLQPGTRRGPAPEAQMLYEDLSPPPAPKKPTKIAATMPTREPGTGRPTKKQRRETDQLIGR